jgi:hypothetical protein
LRLLGCETDQTSTNPTVTPQQAPTANESNDALTYFGDMDEFFQDSLDDFDDFNDDSVLDTGRSSVQHSLESDADHEGQTSKPAPTTPVMHHNLPQPFMVDMFRYFQPSRQKAFTCWYVCEDCSQLGLT